MLLLQVENGSSQPQLDDGAACAAYVKTSGSKGVPALDKAETALLPPTTAAA